MKGIIFDSESIHGIREGRKSMTQRIMKPQPIMDEQGMWHWKDCQWLDGRLGFPESAIEDYAPHKPGDILYVKEAWNTWNPQQYYYRADSDCVAAYGTWIDDCPDGEPLTDICELCEYMSGNIKWRSPMHMPKAAARIFLRVAEVRVERLWEISHEDVLREGIAECPGRLANSHEDCACAEIRYQELWDRLNAKRGFPWESNCWVWVYTFEQISREEAKE